MTGHGDVPLAVEAMKLGALDFLEKPFEEDRLIGMIETALSQNDSGAKSEAVTADIGSRLAQPHPARTPGDAGAGEPVSRTRQIAGNTTSVRARSRSIAPTS